MNAIKRTKRMMAMLLVLVLVFSMLPVHAHAAGADATLTASLEEAKNYIDGITINNSSNDPTTVVKNFKTHFTWDNEKRENSKSYLFDWSYYNGVVFEGIEYVYEVTGEEVYKDYVIEYMSSLINANGGWATCSNNSSKQCAGYNSTHGADCYKTASLLLDAYEMTNDSRYLTMAATLYADLDSAAKSYSLSNAGNNYRHTWASDPSPDLWLDGLYMILPFRAEYAKYIGDTDELDLIVDRMQWVSDNMYNSSKGLFYHAADSASSNSGTYWLRSIGWYAAAIVDIMDSMEGENLEAMKKHLVKLVDGMKACQNASNGMWLNNMNASQSSSNPYETSGTALVCYAVMKAVNNGWLDESYADMAILAFNGICSEKLSGSNLTDICFKGAPGSSNSTFYDNEGKGVGPFIMFYAEVLEYVNAEEEVPETTVPEETEPETTEPEETEPETTEPEETEPEETEPEEEETIYEGTGNLEADFVYTRDTDGINSGEKYLIVYSSRALENNNGVDNNPTVSISNNTITLEDDSTLAWTITQSSGSNYYVENNGSYVNLSNSQNDPIGSSATVYITGSSTYKFRNASSSGAYLRYSNSQLWCAGTSSSNNSVYLYRNTGSGTGEQVVFTITPLTTAIQPGEQAVLNGTVSVGGESVALNNCTITWTSSNAAYVTVSGGTVTGVAGGEANITATLSAVNGTALKENIVLTIPVTVQGHNYEAVVTAPTCTEDGYTTYTCTVCGDSYTEVIPATGEHNYERETVDATCAEDGSVTYTCATCGDSYTEVIEAVGHIYTGVVTEATCTEGGCTTYTCGVCGDSYVADYTDALGHSYETVTVEPTCTENGSITYACAVCGDSYTEAIEATGHSYSGAVTDPTCTETGYTTYTCHCGDSYVADHTDALGHDYDAVTVEPTCTEGGCTTYTCTNCGGSYVAGETAALGHDYASVTADPTCTEGGYTTHTCAVCGHSYVDAYTDALGHDLVSVVTEATCETDGYTTRTCSGCGEVSVDSYVAALGHNYETVTVEATCTENGSVSSTCTACGDHHEEVIQALGHDYDAVTVEPTCTEGGYTTYTCGNCGDSHVADYTGALGHAYETVTVQATCTENGSVTCTCACGDTYTEVIEATGHNYESAVTEAACETAGYTTHTCVSCGDNYITDEVAALGHDYDAVTVKPTCTEGGYTTYTCTVCGGSYVADVTEALDHDYSAVVTDPTCTEDGYTTYTCTVCGDSYAADETNAPGHSYETVTEESTCTENGSVTHTCHCGDSYTEVIEATGHSYTCVESDGYLIYTCDYCGDTYSESIGWIALPSVYTLDTDGIETGEENKYIIVGNSSDYALTLSNGTIGAAAVTVDGDTITLENPDTYEFYFVDNSGSESGSYLLTQNGTQTVYHANGYIYYGSDNKGYWHVVSGSNGSYQLYDYDNLNWYLNYGYVWSSDSVSRFAVSSNARYVRLFKGSESYVRLTGEMVQTCTDADGATESSVLEKVSIQTSADGSAVSGTVAVTSDLVAWDTAFDGTTAGTYTGTVTYHGTVLGTITVTVTSEHAYETTVVAPTCTEGGYTVRTCTECGVSYVNNHTDALGHSYSCVEADGYLVYTCDHCGDSYSEKSATYSRVSAIASGNNYVITMYSSRKYYALSHANNSISVVEITVSNGEITSEITEDLVWSYSDSKLSYESDGTTYYLYASSGDSWWGNWWGSSTLSLSTSNSSTVSFSSSKLKVGSYYLRYSGGSVSLNRSASTTYLFVEE